MGFFQTFWTWLSAQLTTYISANTALIATAIEPAAVALSVVYVMMWGFLQLTGRIEEPFTTGLARIARLALVLGVGIHLWLYNDVIVDTFYRAPSQLASAVIGSSDPVASVDTIWSRGGAVADALMKNNATLGAGIIRSIMGCIVWLVVGLLCIYVMFLISLSSIATAMLLAVGPLFIVLCLFDSTRRFFEAWVTQLANYALVTILTVLMAALLLHIVQSYAAQTADRGFGLQLVDALDMLLMVGLALMLMRQIMPIAAGLAGGPALSSFNALSRAILRGPGHASRARELALGLYHKFDSTTITQLEGVTPQRGALLTGNQHSPSWQD